MLARCQQQYFPLSRKTPWFPESYFQRNAICFHGNVEDSIRSLPFIFHINYDPGNCISVQRASTRTSMEVTKNFSGKAPPGDSGKVPSDFVDSWNCWISCVPLISCSALSQDCSTHLSDKTQGTISDTILRRHSLLHEMGEVFYFKPHFKPRQGTWVTLQSCGAKGHVATTLDLACTDMNTPYLSSAWYTQCPAWDFLTPLQTPEQAS